jgi:predicted PurR-regulated permease PerM
MAETAPASEVRSDAITPVAGQDHAAGEAPEAVRVVTAGPRTEQPGLPREGVSAGDPARVAQVLVAIVVLVGVITYLGPILKPFLVAVFLFFATKSAARFLIRRGFPPSLAYLTLFVVGSALATLLVLLAITEMEALQAEWHQEGGPHDRILALIARVPAEVREPLTELVTLSSKTVFQQIFERGVGILELLIMTFFYLLFILLGSSRLPQRACRAFPGGRGERMVAVSGEIGTGIERFMKVKTQVSLGMGVSVALLAYLFGLRGSLLWGILFFAFNYITYIGSIVACVPPVALAFLTLDPVAAAVLSGLIVFLRIVWIDYIEIKMAGRQLNIDSILLFLWLAYWGWMWGVIGLILAFPMLNSLKIVLERLEGTKGWAVLMSEE